MAERKTEVRVREREKDREQRDREREQRERDQRKRERIRMREGERKREGGTHHQEGKRGNARDANHGESLVRNAHCCVSARAIVMGSRQPCPSTVLARAHPDAFELAWRRFDGKRDDKE